MALNDYNHGEDIIQLVMSKLIDETTGINARIPAIEARYDDDIPLDLIDYDINIVDSEELDALNNFPGINVYLDDEGELSAGNNFLSVPVGVQIAITDLMGEGDWGKLSKRIRRYSVIIFRCMEDAFRNPGTHGHLRHEAEAYYVNGENRAIRGCWYTGSRGMRTLENDDGDIIKQNIMRWFFRQIRE